MSLVLPKLIVFASGTKTGGGSGFRKLVEAREKGALAAEFVGVVSNHEDGGVRRWAGMLGVPFIHSPRGRTADDYRRIVEKSGAEFVALSGWLGKVEGLNPQKTFNIHPALLPSKFGGKGMHGHHIHEAVHAAMLNEGLTHSGVTMHFVTEVYDDHRGIFFRRNVPLDPSDTPETIGARVNGLEHIWQARMTDLVLSGAITWDGKNPESMQGAQEHIQPLPQTR